jgi:Domain of unknown function (DUF4274)
MATSTIEQQTGFTTEELNHLAWSTTVPEDGDWEAQAEGRIEWLEQASPEQWHSFVLGFNWNDELDPLFWIAQQHDCDMATALTIFWRSEPGWDLMMMAEGEADYSRPESAMIRYIANRISAGGYTQRKIAWDPEPGMRADFDDMKAKVAMIASPPWTPHPDMLKTRRGREVVESFDAWQKRPDAVRTGFWLSLPDSDIITPHMIEAKDRLSASLFYLFTLGCAAPMAIALARKPAENMFWIVVLMCFAGWWSWSVMRGNATVRALVREEFKCFPKWPMLAVYSGCVLLGTLAWLLYSLVLTPHPRPDISTQAEWIEKGMLAVTLFGVWFGLGQFARVITYRFLFR